MIDTDLIERIAALLDQIGDACGDTYNGRLLIIGDIESGQAICLSPRDQSPAVAVEMLINSAHQIMESHPQLRVHMLQSLLGGPGGGTEPEIPEAS